MMEYISLYSAFNEIIQPHQIDMTECNHVLAELYMLNNYKHAIEHVLSSTELSVCHIMCLSDIINELAIKITQCEKKLDTVFSIKHFE